MATAIVSISPRPEPPPEAFDRDLNTACDGQNDGRAVTLEQYLNTVYNPDCDYIDDHLQERNWGEFDHANLQGELSFTFVPMQQNGTSSPSPSSACRSPRADSECLMSWFSAPIRRWTASSAKPRCSVSNI
jgi:hypothetical protein